MPTYALNCPACGTVLQAKLKAEVTPVACDACGNVFLAQRPESVAKGQLFEDEAPPKRTKEKKIRELLASGSKAEAPEVPSLFSEVPPPPPPPPLSLAVLEAGDDVTSSLVIAHFKGNKDFKSFAKSEMEAILARDMEDDLKLVAGIALAVKKGAVPPPEKLPLEPVTTIDVLGLNADAVAAKIVGALGDAPSRGCVLVLQGLSGTGKGTTVAKLQALLPKASTWSNGNIFRALTLLALEYFNSHGLTFSVEALSPALVAQLVKMLHFEQTSPKGAAVPTFDVRIDGLGIRAMLSQIANTALKDANVSKNIPSVASVTQGEVIAFAAGCAEKMRQAGMNVLIEGRAPTLQFVRTPFRFELTLSKPLVIGKRRAAQRLVGIAMEGLKKGCPAGAPPPEPAAVTAALEKALVACTSK